MIAICALAGLAVWFASAPPSLSPHAIGRWRRRGLVVALFALGPILLIGLPPRRWILVILVLASLADLARRFRRRRRGAERSRRSALLSETCEALAADLQAGVPPARALEAAAIGWPEFGPVARAAQLGSDVPEAMRALARLPGAGQIRVVAAAWQVASRTGAGLASALTLASSTLREERATAAVVATELAAARSTARMLTMLPVGVLLLGSGTGGDPLAFLLDTVPGLGCFGLGLLLVHLGLAWLDTIADGVSR